MRIIRWGWRKWKDLKIQSKFFITYLLLAVLPLSAFGVAAYFIAGATLEKKANDSFMVITRQINYNVDAYLRGIDRMTILPFIDQRIYAAMTKMKLTTEASSADLSQIEKDMNTYFTSLQVLNEGIVAVYMITNQDQAYGYSLDTSIRPDNTLKGQLWYENALKLDGGIVNSGLRSETQVYTTSGKQIVSLARSVKQADSSEHLGVFVVDIDPYIFNFTAQKPKEGSVVLVDQLGNIIHSSIPVQKDQVAEFLKQGKALGPNLLTIQWESPTGELVGAADTSEYSGWTTIYFLPKKTLYEDLSRIRNLALVIISVLLFFSIIVASFVARGVASPIKRLIRLMNKVHYGGLDVSIDMNQKDEIGLLSRSFNRMMRELSELIERIKQEEKSKRKAEMDALRAQINPHFIYNTLSAVKMMAMMQSANDIARVLDIFIQLMKYCTRSDRKWVTVEEEINFIKDYVSLLERRYMKRFALTFNVEDCARQAWIMPFLIQPIVENAIFHGFSGDNGDQAIELRAQHVQDELIIVVKDQGKGIEADQIRRLLNSDAEYREGLSGTGLKNIHERIRLEFGSPYGLSIESIVGKGTTVTIRVPFMLEKEEL